MELFGLNWQVKLFKGIVAYEMQIGCLQLLWIYRDKHSVQIALDKAY